MSNIVPIQSYPGHPLRSLKQFAAKADEIVGRYDPLENLVDGLREKIEAAADRALIDKLFADARRAVTFDKYDKTLLAWCEAAVERFDPEDSYELDAGDFHLKPSVVAARIAVLVGAFPSGAPSDTSVYLKMMLEHVCSVEALNLIALDAAIWEAVGTLKFLPSASELMVIVKRQKEKWHRRFMAIRDIAEWSQGIIEEIEHLQVEAEKAAKARVVPQARAALNAALRDRASAVADAVAAQQRAAIAAQAVESKMACLAQCEEQVLDAERALAEAEGHKYGESSEQGPIGTGGQHGKIK